MARMASYRPQNMALWAPGARRRITCRPERTTRAGMQRSSDRSVVRLPDLFHDAVEGLWPDDFEWMFLGVAGRSRTRDDLVVDLEKATAEVLSFQNRARKPADHSPHWGGPGVVLEEPRDDR